MIGSLIRWGIWRMLWRRRINEIDEIVVVV